MERQSVEKLKGRLKPIFNTGEARTFAIAEEVSKATGTRAFAKVRIADVITIQNSGIPDDFYKYALSGHFDVLVYKEEIPYLAIEFDGSGHSTKNDEKKERLCNLFELPMVRVGPQRINAVAFEDTAIAFFIWQLHCVDAFLEEYGNDPYEIYDPLFFISVPGRSRTWPFAYRERWLGRLTRRFKESVERFEGDLRQSYEHGILQFNHSFGTWWKEGEFRSIVAQKVTSDTVVWGEAGLSLKVYGLDDRRLGPFYEVSTFVQGMAAEQMYQQALKFLAGKAEPTKMSLIVERIKSWEAEGFRLRIAANLLM
jgi:hypothetical protein